MKRLILTLFALVLCAWHARTEYTVISNAAYTSYFSLTLKEPLLVSYRLWQGGGNCSRARFRFKNDTQLPTATDQDYAHHGYDKGHLANAEDFAGNCALDEMTFRYYNCLPQTPQLNRGIWKTVETQLRRQSQTDSLWIVCGGLFEDRTKIMGNGVVIPNMCWKVSQNLKTKKIEHVWLFTNDSQPTVQETSVAAIEKRLGVVIPLKN